MNARSLARELECQLAAAGVPQARFEAELLVRTAAGIDRATFFAGRCLDEDAVARARHLGVRRREREPAAYLIGQREFFGRSFTVTPDVLIPRPETELLVELALRELTPGDVVFDVGTGSGCVALSVAAERPGARVLGLDISTRAMAVARANAERHGAEVAFARSHLASAVVGADVVVANLPYIPTAEVEQLQPEVRDWEPRLALDGGRDGLALIRELVADCARRLRPRFLALEVMAGQAPAVAQLLREAGPCDVRAHRDLAGIERVVTGRWA